MALQREASFNGNDAQKGLADTGGICGVNSSGVLWTGIQSTGKMLVANSKFAFAH